MFEAEVCIEQNRVCIVRKKICIICEENMNNFVVVVMKLSIDQ